MSLNEDDSKKRKSRDEENQLSDGLAKVSRSQSSGRHCEPSFVTISVFRYFALSTVNGPADNHSIYCALEKNVESFPALIVKTL